MKKILFIIIILNISMVNAWSPDTFCQKESNGSFSEYISCNNYFLNISNPLNVNYTNIINYTNNVTQNNTYIIYNNITRGLDEDDLKIQLKSELKKQLNLLQLPEDFTTLVTINYLKDRMYVKSDIDTKNELQDKEILTLKTAFQTLATQLTNTIPSKDNEEILELKQKLAESQKVEPKPQYAIYALMGLIVLLVAGYFFQQNFKEKEALKQVLSQRTQYPKKFEDYNDNYEPKPSTAIKDRE